MKTALVAMLCVVGLIVALWVDAALEKPPKGWPTKYPVPRVVTVDPAGTACWHHRIARGTIYRHCIDRRGNIVESETLLWGRLQQEARR